MFTKRILAAALVVLMLVAEPIYSQCRSCGRASSGSGRAHGGLFGGRGLFAGRLRSRLAERRERRANRRAARHEAGCGRAAASCGASSSECPSCPNGECPIRYEENFDGAGDVPPAPEADTGSTKEIVPGNDLDDAGSPPRGTLRKSNQFGAHAAWQPPFTLRPSAIDAPTPFDAPARPAQTAAAKSFIPAPLGAIVAPY